MAVELHYLFITVWGREVQIIFYVLIIVLFLVLSVVAFCSVLLIYVQLNCEDYRWWWNSVLIGG